MMDTIEIRGLQVATRIGVPEAERKRWQTLELDLTLTPRTAFADVDDDLSKTVDYEAVCLKLRDWAETNERHLLEVFGEDLTSKLLATFALSEVDLTIRKFIIPGAESVGIHLTRKSALA